MVFETFQISVAFSEYLNFAKIFMFVESKHLIDNFEVLLLVQR